MSLTLFVKLTVVKSSFTEIKFRTTEVWVFA